MHSKGQAEYRVHKKIEKILTQSHRDHEEKQKHDKKHLTRTVQPVTRNTFFLDFNDV